MGMHAEPHSPNGTTKPAGGGLRKRRRLDDTMPQRAENRYKQGAHVGLPFVLVGMHECTGSFVSTQHRPSTYVWVFAGFGLPPTKRANAPKISVTHYAE